MSAYEAWWFLYEHPLFQVKERTYISVEQAGETSRSWTVKKDPGGNFYREWELERCAMEENLDITYALVDETRRVNDDPAKNVNVECWLEFGEIKYGYAQPEFDAQDGEKEHLMHYHDLDLDCGGKTFDEALVKLAELVKEKYPQPALTPTVAVVHD